MSQPNYSQLLQTVWYGADAPNDSETNSMPSQFTPGAQPTDVLDVLGDSIAWEHTFPGVTADLESFPDTIPAELVTALHAQGITGLYSHQVKTYRAVRAGKDVILTPPTAAGKTLAAYIPVLEGVIEQGHHALSLYGLKALASDQTAKLQVLLAGIPRQERPCFIALTGDVAKDQRKRLLAKHPQLLAMTPDLLHFELKQVYWSEDWQAFWQSLRYVILDEVHTYQGVFGANMHWLLARLKLAIDRCGGNSSQVQFIGLSATVGNAKELMSALTGRNPIAENGTKRLVWIRQSGATQAEKRLLVTHPSTNANGDVARLMVVLMQQMQGITFCNNREATKRIVQLVQTECERQGYSDLSRQVASFYGSLDDERRHQIVQQLEAGSLRWIVATEALEAGIDLPQLDCCIVRGFPDTLMSFYQRIGRAGRKDKGLAILVPIAQTLLDTYASTPEHLLASPEPIHFNPHYPVMVAKHLMCAAAESGFSAKQIRQYFGKAALPVAQALLPHLKQRRDGTFYAPGFPHSDINLRGGQSTQRIELVDQATGQVLEAMAGDVAQREVFPGAIYRLQQASGAWQVYRVNTLDEKAAQMDAIDAPTLYTTAHLRIEGKAEQALHAPVSVPLQMQGDALTEPPPSLTLTLHFGEITQVVSGYDLQRRSYERTCVQSTCVQHKTPLPETTRCPSCRKPTRGADIIQTLDTTHFPTPYQTQFHTPTLHLTFNATAQQMIRQGVLHLRQQVQDTPEQSHYRALWDYPSHWVAVHSIGHLLMRALPLVVLHSPQDVNFLCESLASDTTVGLWFDTSDGGNGATEAILKYWQGLVPKAIELAEGCDCHTGCPKCLTHWGCPNQNQGLVKQVGLSVLRAMLP